MLRIRVLGVCGIVFLLVVVSLPQTARAAMDRPVWSAGDFWAYRITGGAFGASGNGKMRVDVLGTETATVGGTDYQTYHSKLALNLTSGSLTFNLPGEMWFRTADLAPVKTVLVVTFEILPFTFVATTTVTYNPPPEIRWPLEEGRSWPVASVVTTVVEITGQPSQPSTASLSLTYAVQAGGTVTVPAGDFSTIAIRSTQADGNYTRTHWSPAAGNLVKEETFNSNDQEQSSLDLTSYRYAAAAGVGTFLGVPIWLWILIAVLVVAAVIAAFAIQRKRPPVPQTMPPGMPMGEIAPRAPPVAPP